MQKSLVLFLLVFITGLLQQASARPPAPERVLQLGHTSGVNAVAFAPDGQSIVSGSRDNTLKIWNASNGALIRTLAGHTVSVSAVAFAPDGQSIVSGSWDNTLKIWNASNGALIRTLAGHTAWVNAVAFAPDGQSIVSGSSDTTLKIWNASNGALIHTLAGHTTWVNAVAFAPDGQSIVSGSWDNTLKIWNASNGELLRTMIGLPANEWLSWTEKNLGYVSSNQGDEGRFMRLAFTPVREKLYPLEWYRDQLQVNNPNKTWTDLPASIEPKPWRYWWEITLDTQDKQLGGSVLLMLFMFTGFVTFWRIKNRRDAFALAKAFFPAGGFPSVKKVSEHQLDLSGAESSVALRWQQGLNKIKTIKLDSVKKIYLLLDRNTSPPKAKEISDLSELHDQIPVIPLSAEVMELAIRNDDAGRRLLELEQLYLTRTDPYLDKNPIDFRQFFFGRSTSLSDLLQMLSQGQHVGVFGLRKVGKTSLIKQVQQRFTQSPLVMMDCQTLAPRQSVYYQHIVESFDHELRSLKVKKAPRIPSEFSFSNTQKYLYAAIQCWRDNGRNEPLILVFDEIDRLFPERSVANSLDTLSEYIPLFQLLRGIAQTSKLLSLLVVAYRPNINRFNRLDSSLPENPMYSAFKEHYLGFFSPEESLEMILGIGAMKKIVWTEAAAKKVFFYCAGHPMLSRLFASEVSEEGDLKNIDLEIVETAAKQIQKNLRRNEIGVYFKESIWPELNTFEKQLLTQIVHQQAIDSENLSDAEDDAINALLNLGLVAETAQGYSVCGELLKVWLLRNTVK